MAHHEGDARRAKSCLRQEQRVLDREAEPVHARVDVERGAGQVRPGPGAARRLPGAELLDRAQHGIEPVVAIVGRSRAVGMKAVQHEDAASESRAPQRVTRLAPFPYMGHEEGPASGPRQSRHDGRAAAAIGVGLDGGPAFGRCRAYREGAPVVAERVEVDGQHRLGVTIAVPGRAGQGSDGHIRTGR